MMKANTAGDQNEDSSEDDELILKEPHEIPGYFKEKFKRNLGNINHFI
jgi:hypothetical protein